MSSVGDCSLLYALVERLMIEGKARAIAVAVHDFESGSRFSIRSDRWFHAASTIKVAVLLAVFRAADEGRLRLDDSLHVRNRFISAADGTVFRVSQDRDAEDRSDRKSTRLNSSHVEISYAVFCLKKKKKK